MGSEKTTRPNIIAVEGLKKVNNLLNLNSNDKSGSTASQSEPGITELP